MFKIRLLIASLLFCLGQYSCKITNDEDANVDIDEVFNLDMIEDLQQDRTLNFIVTSVDYQDCENATIEYSLQQLTSRIDLSLNEIVAPADCTPGQSLATTSIPLGTFATPQEEPIFFRIKSTIENTSTLYVREEGYELVFDTKDGFNLIPEKLYRVPSNFLWGYMAFNDETIAGDTPQNFRSDVATLSNQFLPTKGYYGHFTINEEEQLELRNPTGFQKVRTLFFEYTGENQPLIDLLETYRSTMDGEEVEFRLYRADGSVL